VRVQVRHAINQRSISDQSAINQQSISDQSAISQQSISNQAAYARAAAVVMAVATAARPSWSYLLERV
jgi:hypothetical protein